MEFLAAKCSCELKIKPASSVGKQNFSFIAELAVRDHLCSNLGIISSVWGSFVVQFGDHLWSGIICGAMQCSNFAIVGFIMSYRGLFGAS